MVTDHSGRSATTSEIEDLLTLHGCSGHLAAFLRTATARFGAALAVTDVVLFALGSTGIADFGAQTTEVSGEL